jgi:hypothetical protein
VQVAQLVRRGGAGDRFRGTAPSGAALDARACGERFAPDLGRFFGLREEWVRRTPERHAARHGACLTLANGEGGAGTP